MKTYVYIDGFNFYYGAVKGTSYKWLDFRALCAGLFPSNDILKIKYFTAMVDARSDPDRPFRQRTFLQAIKAHGEGKVEVIEGHFRTDAVLLPIAKTQEKCAQNQVSDYRIWVMKNEEKGSDVNLAVHLVNDAHMNLYDAAIVFSNDSDLEEAMRIVKTKLHKKIGLVNPHKNKNSCVQLNRQASFHGRITDSLLAKCQLPATIPGTGLHKPREW